MKLEGMIIKVDGKLYRLNTEGDDGCSNCALSKQGICDRSGDEDNPLHCNRIKKVMGCFVHFKELKDD